jgi:hypothetical protein
MARNSIRRATHWEIGLWLIFSDQGDVRLTRTTPGLNRNERAMALTVNIPHTLFQQPTLRATIAIDAPDASVPTIDLTAASEALRASLGVDVDVRIAENEA